MLVPLNTEHQTLGTILCKATAILTAAGIENAGLDARLMLQEVLHISHEALIIREEYLLNTEEKQLFMAMVARRGMREPLAYIVGKKEFWGLDFKVTRDTLIPRPDSETLIEAVLRQFPTTPPKTILDLGTGTGCLLIALLTEWKEARGVGIDVNAGALEIARTNAKANHVHSRANFIHNDWMNDLSGEFEVILSNPPYIAAGMRDALSPEVRDFEPHEALFAEENGLAHYQKILGAAPHHLTRNGVLALEIGQGQAMDVVRLIESHGLHCHSLTNDLAGIPRAVLATHNF